MTRLMRVYAGIDEAGYGPLLGPLIVGRCVLALRDSAWPASTGEPASPDVWSVLHRAVCRRPKDRQSRIAVDDSKTLTSKTAGLRNLERGVLAFAAASGLDVPDVGQWLAHMTGCELDAHALLPWYTPTQDHPWQSLPDGITPGELAVARGMLCAEAGVAGAQVLSLGAAVVFEDRFNRMVHATRSKAAVSFTFVASHLQDIWRQFGDRHPLVVVDRQSGRMRYLDLLRPCFEDAAFTIWQENPEISSYDIRHGDRRMTVRFVVDGDAHDLPVALASMTSKYTRELLMARFQNWFTRRVPQVKPTAGYALDGKRFLDEIRPHLHELQITEDTMVRVS
ncbi:MAG: hypothetical protein IT440_08270 [Phycisphaeraceae bacterium]|nr:hypothetical protein [Phycisphaeraceae bacterium]